MDQRPETQHDELSEARRMRQEAYEALSMRERLARLHVLSKQMTAIKGTARTDSTEPSESSAPQDRADLENLPDG